MRFIVRTSIDGQGPLQGVIQHVQGGRKETFQGVAQLGELLAVMTAEGSDALSGLTDLEEDRPGAKEGEA